jgi:hypothetical protein
MNLVTTEELRRSPAEWRAHYDRVRARLRRPAFQPVERKPILSIPAPILSAQPIGEPAPLEAVEPPQGQQIKVEGELRVYGPPRRPNADRIIREVVKVTGVSHVEIMSPRREQRIVNARHVAMWFARQFTILSFPQIGRKFGDRDHSTVLMMCRKIDGLLARGDERVTAIVEAVAARLAVVEE